MGFFDFLKKKEPVVSNVEKVKFEELEGWLQSKEIEVNSSMEVFLSQIKSRLSQLAKELEAEIVSLRKVDLKEKKASPREEFIVKTNLDKYIKYGDSLLAELKGLDEPEPVKLIEASFSILSAFEKQSGASFYKANFLVGKELDDIRQSIIGFIRDSKKLQETNKDLISKARTVSLVRAKIDEIAELKGIEVEFGKKIGQHEQEIKSLEEKSKLKQSMVEEIKASSSYAEFLAKKELLEKGKAEFVRELHELKEMIDFKLLADRFHRDEKKMNLVKEYKAEFWENLQKDNGARLLSLLKDSGLGTDALSEKIKAIIQRKAELENNIPESTGVEELESTAKQFDDEIRSIIFEKSLESKKQERLKATSSAVLASMQAELAKMNVSLSD